MGGMVKPRSRSPSESGRRHAHITYRPEPIPCRPGACPDAYRGPFPDPYAPFRPAERSRAALYTRTDDVPPAEAVCADDCEHRYGQQDPTNVWRETQNYETKPFASYERRDQSSLDP